MGAGCVCGSAGDVGSLGGEEGDSSPARHWAVAWEGTVCLYVLSMIITPDRVKL